MQRSPRQKREIKGEAINSNMDTDQRKETKETNGQLMPDSGRETRTPNKILATKQSSEDERKKRQAKLHQ